MPRNIVLVCLDTVRKDFFDEYTPKLQDLADVSFEQCRAASSWSVPSHASILTGKLPSNHGIHTYNPTFSQLNQSDTFLADLESHRSICVSSNLWAGSTFGFTNNFDEYSDVTPRRYFTNGAHMKEFNMWYESGNKILELVKYSAKHDHSIKTFLNGVLSKGQSKIKQLPGPSPFDGGATKVIKNSLQHIEHGSEPFFLFTNFMDAHGPLHHILGHDHSLHSVPLWWDSTDFDYWDVNLDDEEGPNKRSIKWYRELYRTAIDYLDRKVAKFIETVCSVTSEKTTILITADHGENLAYSADEGLFNHVGSLSEALLHVPMYIVNPPKGYQTKERDYFSHLDLGELLIELADGDTPDLFRERIPAELIGGNLATRSKVPENKINYWDRLQRCVYKENQKYLWDSQQHSFLYKLDPETPCWQQRVQTNISIPDRVLNMFKENISTAKQTAQNTERIELDQDTKSRLSDLGYV